MGIEDAVTFLQGNAAAGTPPTAELVAESMVRKANSSPVTGDVSFVVVDSSSVSLSFSIVHAARRLAAAATINIPSLALCPSLFMMILRIVVLHLSFFMVITRILVLAGERTKGLCSKERIFAGSSVRSGATNAEGHE
jgi:hypothetical protein